MKILVINGPNLNFLGIREPEIYGTMSHQQLVEQLIEYGKKNECEVLCYQSNYEGEIIERIQQAYFEKMDAIIINPGALTHYSYALYDAIKSVGIKTVEVHMSDIENREAFRKTSVIRDACLKTFFGKLEISYFEAIDFLFAFK